MLIVFDKMTYKNKYDDNSNIDTISYPPADLLKVKLIERRSKAISAIENYYKLQDMEAQGFLWEVKAKVRSLFYEISAAYRRNNEKEYIKIMENLTSNEFSDIEEVFHQINQWLDQKNLTRLDTGRNYNKSDPEQENEVKL